MEPTAISSEAIIARYLQAFDQACADTGLTAQKLAATIGISNVVISHLRSGGVKTLRADYVANLCTQEGYSVVWMLTGEGEMKTEGETASIQQDIARLKKDMAKVLELQKDVIGPLINELLGIKINPNDVKGKLISEVKKHTRINS